MLNTQKFDIIVLSETWLNDNSPLRDYVKIDGYEIKLRNSKEVAMLVYISDQSSNANLEMIL